jgi:hypothetical protein
LILVSRYSSHIAVGVDDGTQTPVVVWGSLGLQGYIIINIFSISISFAGSVHTNRQSVGICEPAPNNSLKSNMILFLARVYNSNILVTLERYILLCTVRFNLCQFHII